MGHSGTRHTLLAVLFLLLPLLSFAQGTATADAIRKAVEEAGFDFVG